MSQTPDLSPDLKKSHILREILLLLDVHTGETPLSNHRIAADLWISAVLTSKSIQTLSEGGLVLSTIGMEDRRERLSVLSDYGRRQAQTIRQREREFVAALERSTGWDSSRMNSFLQSLRDLSLHLESAATNPAKRTSAPE